MRIKRLNELDINEGLLSSLFSGIKKIFSSKETNIDSILKKIKEVRSEEIFNLIETEKQIWSLAKDNSPEYRFQLNNLNRQSRIHSSLKNQEINSLIKQAENEIGNNPKLQAFFSSGLAKIEAEVAEKFIKNIKPYKDKPYLDHLNAEFDLLTKDANIKNEFYNDYKEKKLELPDESLYKNLGDKTIELVDMSNQDAYAFIKNAEYEDLDKIYKDLRELYFELEEKYILLLNSIKKDIIKANKEGQRYMIPAFEKERIEIKYNMKKPIDKIKNRIDMIDREKRARKNVNN